ncbi:bifunctional Poly(A) polymerase [Babesia duncani]|uniref:Poly(A) polymerase n=1 Tax=Babesia duncani TaxID=323732 RepID=A0AAD9PLI7_9APIC|nr:bifunctional Poly(A) polymerase [Babesia duncani]
MANAVEAAAPKRYGISDPVNTDGPKQEDEEESVQLLELLKSHNLFETDEGKLHRKKVLEAINRLLQQFARAQAEKSVVISEDDVPKVCAKLLTFGSYRLGIIAPDSDIDVLCLCPKFITREAFFSDFYNTLSAVDVVTKLHAVPDAYTPVIKMVYDSIDIDLLFANLSTNIIPEDLNILDDNILRNMNEATARSVNGTRVASLILDSVPNKDVFRLALRYVKLWAVNRGLYTTVMCYLGGVAWAILTARICQMYPNYLASQIVQKFFRVYAIWNWKFAVMLYKIKEVPKLPGFLSFKVWDPRSNSHDRQHLMPVITPAFPAMNSTHNVTATTKRVLTAEFIRARDILMQKGIPKKQLWDQVLTKENIFADYKHFMMIEILARDEHAHGKWEGWIGSRMRFLIKKLETVPNIKIRPWPEFYKFAHSDFEYASAVFFAFKINVDGGPNGQKKTLDLRPCTHGFMEIINQWPDLETFRDQVSVKVHHKRQSELPTFVQPRKSLKRKLHSDSNSN